MCTPSTPVYDRQESLNILRVEHRFEQQSNEVPIFLPLVVGESLCSSHFFCENVLNQHPWGAYVAEL